MFILKHLNCFKYKKLSDNSDSLRKITDIKDYQSIVANFSGNGCYTIQPHDFCILIKDKFNDPYYNKNNIWDLHMEEYHSRVTLMNYDAVHYILGCEMFKILYNRCPRTLIIPMATLLSLCPNYIILNHTFECLYRNVDEAIGLDFGAFKAYLIPTYIGISDTSRFENVTIY
jgi:hypothetical protein